MQSARFDFEALQPSVLRMIRSARSHLHRPNSSQDGESARVVRSASSRRSSDYKASLGSRLMRSRSSVMKDGSSENVDPGKTQAPTRPSAVLGDATNTYVTAQQPVPYRNGPSPAKAKTLEHRFSHMPAPPNETAMGDKEISAQQLENPQHAGEYVQDIFRVLKHKESQQCVSPTYMDRQVHLNAKMRGILIDWLVDVAKKYKLRAETLFLAVQLIDRYLEVQATPRGQLQLVGATALMIAAKFEEIHPPKIKEFETITDKAYSCDEILKMEVCILKALKFDICCPTAMHFLDRYHSINGCTEEHRHIAHYLLELSLIDYKMLKYGASHVAAASILLSNKLLRRQSWTPALTKHTQLTEAMLRECAKEMCVLLENAEGSSLQAVRKKFSQASYHSVAKLNFVAGRRSSDDA